MIGMGSYWVLSLLVFCPLGLPLEPLGWSAGRNVAPKIGGAVGIGCRRLGRRAFHGWWLVVWTKGRGTCWCGKVDGPRGCTVISSNKFVNLANCSSISRMLRLNFSWMFSMALSRASHRYPIFLNLLKINSALSISLDVLYDACMHNARNMKWHVMLKNA